MSEWNAFNKTDIGNAERLVKARGDDLRYIATQKRWLYWDGTRWQTDTTRLVEAWAKEVCRGIVDEALALHEQQPNTAARDALIKWGLASEGDQRVRATVRRAEAERGFARCAEEFDSDSLLLNIETGTLHLERAELTEMQDPHTRDDNLTMRANVTFDPTAECPLWIEFLNRIMLGRQELVDYLQEALGYTLTGETSEQCVFFCVGKGQNGKNTVLDTFRDLMGDYGVVADFQTFVEKRGDTGARNDIAVLQGTRMVTASEAPANVRLAESVIKDMTGGGKIRARRLYQESVEFQPTFKVWFGTNHKPVIIGTDLGIWRRIKIIPFDYTIPDEERVERFADRFIAERPGILNWAIDGMLRWRERGSILTPAYVAAATREYRSESDVLGSYLEERCEFDPQFVVAAAELYSDYVKWCEENREHPLKQKKFAIALEERNFRRLQANHHEPVKRIGLRLWGAIGIDRGHSGKPPIARAREGVLENASNRPPSPPDRRNGDYDHELDLHP